MATLFDELYEGYVPRDCEMCVHYDVCHEYSHVVEMNPDDCDEYEEEGKTLYDEIFGEK